MWFRSLVTWGVSPVWEETIWSIEFMAPVLVSDGFLVDPHECLPGLSFSLWYSMGYFGNLQICRLHKVGGVMILLIFLGIIPLFGSMRRDLK